MKMQLSAFLDIFRIKLLSVEVNRKGWKEHETHYATLLHVTSKFFFESALTSRYHQAHLSSLSALTSQPKVIEEATASKAAGKETTVDAAAAAFSSHWEDIKQRDRELISADDVLFVPEISLARHEAEHRAASQLAMGWSHEAHVIPCT